MDTIIANLYDYIKKLQLALFARNSLNGNEIT